MATASPDIGVPFPAPGAAMSVARRGSQWVTGVLGDSPTLHAWFSWAPAGDGPGRGAVSTTGDGAPEAGARRKTEAASAEARSGRVIDGEPAVASQSSRAAVPRSTTSLGSSTTNPGSERRDDGGCREGWHGGSIRGISDMRAVPGEASIPPPLDRRPTRAYAPP